MRLDDNEIGLIIVGSLVALLILCVLAACVILKITDLEKVLTVIGGIVSSAITGILAYMKGKSDAEKAAIATATLAPTTEALSPPAPPAPLAPSSPVTPTIDELHTMSDNIDKMVTANVDMEKLRAGAR